MKTSRALWAAAAVVVLASAAVAGDMNTELTIDWTNKRLLKTQFGHYPPPPYRGGEVVEFQPAGLRMFLPGRDPDVTQTGVYSLFALAGDGEVVVSFEILEIEQPRTGYGSSVGLAFDVEGSKDTWGCIQRVVKVRAAEGSGFTTQTNNLVGPDKKPQEDYQFVKAASAKGRLGLRRVKKDLTFLAVDSPTEDLQEIKTVPFPNKTIRPFRLFVDNGGSPTKVDVRVTKVVVRTEEKTANIPKIQPSDFNWWWLVLAVPVVLGGGALAWLWYVRRRSD
jgi:hypothetical protein